MKKLLLASLLLSVVALGVNAQDKEKDKVKVSSKDIPQPVKTAFENQFANAANVEWKMKDGKYKAKFKMDGNKHIAELSGAGEVISKGMKIDKDQLPSAISEAVRTGYSSNQIDEVFQVEKGGETQYLVKLDGNPEKKILYNAQGKVIKEKQE